MSSYESVAETENAISSPTIPEDANPSRLDCSSTGSVVSKTITLVVAELVFPALSETINPMS